MSAPDDDRPSFTQFNKLTEKNYRAWAGIMRAVLREKDLFDVVEGTEKPPTPLKDDASESEHDTYVAELKAYRKKALPACRILMSAISDRIMTYVEDDLDNPVEIWRILRDRFRPTTDITMAQALKHIMAMRMAEDGNMEDHIRDFKAAKRRLEEHSVSLPDIVYRTIFLLSMPSGYQMTVTALEGQPNMTLEAIENRLLEEYRKRKESPQNSMVMSALLTNQATKKGKSRGHNSGNSSRNPGNPRNSGLICTHCKKAGHVESTCWSLHPELRRNGKPSINETVNIAFHTTSSVIRQASVKADVKTGEQCDPNHWILDSGASEHFSPYRQLYSSYLPLKEAVNVLTAKGRMQGVGVGNIDIMVEDGGGLPLRITLLNVLHVPDMDVNLLSTNVLLANGAEVNMHPQRGTKIIKDGRVVATTVPHGKLSRIRTIDSPNGASAFKSTTRESIQLPYDVWHRRLAHLGPSNVKKAVQLAKGIAIDPSTFPVDNDKCVACIQGGQTMHYSDQAMRRRTVPGDLIHSDICGWITPNSFGDARYFITFIDDATRMTYLYVLPVKTALAVRDAFMEFRNVFEQDGRRIKSIRTDGGGEYLKQMAALCQEHGIHHEETAPYTPHQNGVAERANRTICERIRSIIAETGLPKALWAEIARTVVYLKNRSPTRSLKDKTPYEALYGDKPDLSHLIAVGTKAMPHIPKSKNQKLDSRAGEGIMVGYGGSNQYRIWSPVDNKVTVTAYADFIDEAKKSILPAAAAAEPERIVYDMIEVLPGPPDTRPASDDNGEEAPVDVDDVEPASDEEELETVTTDAHEASESPQQPPEERRFPARRRGPPKRYESEAWATHTAFSSTSASDLVEPRNYKEAVNHPIYGKE